MEKIPEMLTLKETAERTGIRYEALRQLCQNNEIVHIRIGANKSKYLINYDKLIEYLNGNQA